MLVHLLFLWISTWVFFVYSTSGHQSRRKCIKLANFILKRSRCVTFVSRSLHTCIYIIIINQTNTSCLRIYRVDAIMQLGYSSNGFRFINHFTTIHQHRIYIYIYIYLLSPLS